MYKQHRTTAAALLSSQWKNSTLYYLLLFQIHYNLVLNRVLHWVFIAIFDLRYHIKLLLVTSQEISFGYHQ